MKIRQAADKIDHALGSFQPHLDKLEDPEIAASAEAAMEAMMEPLLEEENNAQ